jgi:protein-disulfide isomerase
VGLVAVTLYQWVFLETTAHRGRAPEPFQPEQILADFQSGPAHEIPTSADDPRLGSSEAPVRIVVFSDFQCPGCKRFAGEMRGLVERFPGKVQIAFKHFPLGPACNDAVKRNLHPQACEAAWAAEAARRQDRFWPYHDALFAARLESGEDTPQTLARRLGLDLDRFQNDLQQPATRAKIAADVALGVELGVDATPSIFVNGRRAHDHRPQSLEVITEHELKGRTD